MIYHHLSVNQVKQTKVKCCNWTDLLLCLVYKHRCLMSDFDSETNEVHFILRCAQIWPKKVKECGVLCARMFPTVGSWWRPFRYRSGWSGGAWLPLQLNISHSHRLGYLYFMSSDSRMKKSRGGGKNGTGKWSREMTLERYDRAWMGTLPVLIRCSQREHDYYRLAD